MCNVTRVKLPRCFLQQFTPIEDPKSGSWWWFPENAYLTERLAAKMRPPEKKRPRSGAPTYLVPTLSRLRSIFTHGFRPVAGDSLSHFFFDPEGMKARNLFGIGRRRTTALFRGDMPELLLNLRREFVVDQLVYFSGLEKTPKTVHGKEAGEKAEEGNEVDEKVATKAKSRGYVIPISRMGDAWTINHAGCVLWFPPDDRPLSLDDVFATIDVKRKKVASKIPVHNAKLVLGEEHIEKLQERAGVFKTARTFVIAKPRTREVQLELWGIQGMLWESPDAKEKREHREKRLSRHQARNLQKGDDGKDEANEQANKDEKG